MRPTLLSHYGPQIIYPSIFQSYFMRRSHFWSQLAHTAPSDGIKNCLREAKVKTSFWNVSRGCIEIWCFWAQIRNLRTKLRLYGSFYDQYWFLWVLTWDYSTRHQGACHRNTFTRFLVDKTCDKTFVERSRHISTRRNSVETRFLVYLHSIARSFSQSRYWRCESCLCHMWATKWSKVDFVFIGWATTIPRRAVPWAKCSTLQFVQSSSLLQHIGANFERTFSYSQQSVLVAAPQVVVMGEMMSTCIRPSCVCFLWAYNQCKEMCRHWQGHPNTSTRCPIE